MEWIKASNRLPEKSGAYFVKRLDDGRKLVSHYNISAYGHGSWFTRIPHLIEWLDER